MYEQGCTAQQMNAIPGGLATGPRKELTFERLISRLDEVLEVARGVAGQVEHTTDQLAGGRPEDATKPAAPGTASLYDQAHIRVDSIERYLRAILQAVERL
jgi:hypothetical protein